MFKNLIHIERENKANVDLVSILNQMRDGRMNSHTFWKNIRAIDQTNDIEINSGYIKNLSEISFFKFCELCQKYRDGMDLITFNGLMIIL